MPWVFKAANIIALPAVQAEGRARELRQSLLGVDFQSGVTLLGKDVSLVDMSFR